jgi:predicted TIM-barrel fold metal-dependent hydrolase
MKIINCHIHTFTIDHVPHKFLPFRLVKILKPSIIRKPLSWIIKNLMPFTDRDILDRYINFIEITANKTQEETFKHVQGYYPKNTKFVILPMDMEFMLAGKVKEKYELQLQSLIQLKESFPEQILPFVAVDPRRLNVLDIVRKYTNEHSFAGIKIYPRLGFYPNDERLLEIYDYAQNNNIPVLSHCSKGGVYTRKITQEMLEHPIRGKVTKIKAKDFSHYFTEPQNYIPLLEKYPDLKICLAHFGGNSEWDSYLEKEWDPNNENQEKSWVAQIVEMMKKYTNLYTDISYTAFHSDRYFPLLGVFLEDTEIKDRIMFGSDFYMVEREKVSEREVSLKIRYALGKEKFEMIADTNVKKFLNINNG